MRALCAIPRVHQLVIPFLLLQGIKLAFCSILPAEAAALMEGPLTIRTTGGRPAAACA